MNFLELAEQTIIKANQALTTNEVWEKAVEFGFDKSLNTKGKTPWATLGARLYVDIRDNQKSIFEAIGKRPTKFWIKGIPIPKPSAENQKNHSEQVIVEQTIVKAEKFHERDLHPLLVKFADTFHHFRGAKLKTIFHENSLRSKKGYNKWIHPDLVGAYFSFNDKIRQYERVVIDFQNDFAITSTKLFSFEMKIRLDIGNLREAYFQAVSNSSWANEGYLVTLKLDEEVIEESRRLANSFGIGLIKLDGENIESSQIIVPAAIKKELDIDSMDRLASENRDFAEFLQNIIDDKKIKKVNSRYDEVFDDIKFEKHLKEKGIIK
ncbi:HTH domain-containing protein [Runella aurantiaca]|uniref:HrgA protein n=1 Tax=Runella aurantiaca TaxID=2282308 RepID=A0A369IBX3_9BACT|nr:HTH domain-containing protein [Runella aurantiaca]RDB07158.1 HrgA protein [Runella aurantiaca]